MRGFIPPQNQEETVFCKKAYAICEKADKMHIKSFSSFLDLRQKELFISQFNKFSGLKLEFYAGFEGDSERTVACVCDEYDDLYEYDYPVSVELSNTEFPTKRYEGFTLPAGEYLALRVLIGEAEGQNWWCVVYPPLCAAASTDCSGTTLSAVFSEEEVCFVTEENPEYILKFKVVEFWEAVRQKWGGNV